MMKNKKLIAILLLALLMVAVMAVAVACDDNKTPTSVTLTVDYGLADVDNATYTVDVDKPFADKLTQPTSSFTFAGWFMSDGSEVTSSTVAPSSDFTVKAKWLAIYRVEYWLQGDDGYALNTDLTIDTVGELGATVNAEVKTISGYSFEENNTNNVASAPLSANGTTLKLYYTRDAVTITFDKNLLNTTVTGSMSAVTAPFGSTVKLPTNAFESTFTFVGWNTAKDGSGVHYDDGANVSVAGDITLYAEWQTAVTVVVYAENSADYTQVDTTTFDGIVGSTVSAQASVVNPDVSKYALDTELSNISGVVSEEGLTLNVYYSLRTFAIRYMDDGAVDYVKYGADYTVRTPEQTDPNYKVLSYCQSPTGNGRNIDFGDILSNVTQDYILYPMSIDIYLDLDGSGDTLEINSRLDGHLGEAVLVRDSVRYEGYLGETNTGMTEFEVEIDGETVYGAIYNDTEFVYRDASEGFYIYYDLILGVYDAGGYMYLDGYGLGILSIFADDGTERYINYLVIYEASEYGDYEMNIYSGDGTEYYGYDFFMIYNFLPDGLQGDSSELDGIFMFCGIEGWYGMAYMLEDGYLSDYAMAFDGYGYAEFYVDDGLNYQLYTYGYYYASENYTEDEPEYIFVSAVEDVEISFYFIWFTQDLSEDETYAFFMIRQDDAGEYHMSDDSEYPMLYLDGYGGAMYFDDEEDAGRTGWYSATLNDTYYIVTIDFFDEIGGSLTVIVFPETGFFTIGGEGDFVIVDGVLIEYVGSSSVIVIPEGVVEIAADVFNGLNITSVTFPSTLEKIGDHAFSNGNVSGGSALKTAIFLGTVAPELGEDVFRWIKGNFKIYVPDGYEDVYRNAESWQYAASQQNGGYAQFVTSFAEQNDKPLYYIVDGVLLSYNNKDENSSDVHVVIPDEATEIAAGVFTNIDYIVSVDLNNVTVIGANAFYGCYNITEIKFNPNTVSIGTRAFYECTGITSVDLGEVQTIGEEAFSRCLSLANVTIGSSIDSIGSYAFYECSRTEEYAYDPEGELIEVVEIFDLVISISATTAPNMGNYIFQGSQPRIYVASYEVALSYVYADAWTTYVNHLRVKADDEQIWYAMSNPGALLSLGDVALFYETYLGLYQWEGNTLRITWVIYSAIVDKVTTDTQVATINADGKLVGIDFTWDGDYPYDFVQAGTTLTYTHTNGTETLTYTFGTNEATFNGNQVELEIVNYRPQFDFDGYNYKVTLLDDGTFYYATKKITVTNDFVAADGSKITLYDGSSKYVIGTLNDVDGAPLSVSTAYSWFLFQLDASMPNVYYFTFNHARGNFRIVLYFDYATGTFEYDWSIYSTVKLYRNDLGDIAVVTALSDGTISSIRMMFSTANGTDQQLASFTQISENVFTIVIDGEVEIEDEEGYVSKEPSSFNGTYTLTLDAANSSFTLEKIS